MLDRMFEFFLALGMKDWIAVWGAVLSTFLAGVKVAELWSARHRIEIEGRFTSDAHIGNQVRIRNLTSKQQIVTNWEIHYKTKYWPFLANDLLICAEHDDTDIKILPNDTKVIYFTDADYYSTSPIALGGRQLVIKLNIAGRKPIHRVIYE